MGGFSAHLLIRILIQFQIKLLYHHQQMIEYIGLNTFVFFPYLVSGKEVNLNGNSISGHFLLADNQVQILVQDVYKRQVLLLRENKDGYQGR